MTGARIAALWCNSSGCVAVGSARPLHSGNLDAIGELWNGSTWTASSIPAPVSESGQAHGAQLNSISCVSLTACMAVGSVETTSSSSSMRSADLAEAWNGKKWTLEPTPNVKGSPFQSLASVHCLSVNDCVAVGQRKETSTLAAYWNGKVWTIERTP
jgi:hypothetical protein